MNANQTTADLDGPTFCFNIIPDATKTLFPIRTEYMLDTNQSSDLVKKFKWSPSVKVLRHQGIKRVKDIFADLSIFRLNVEESKGTTIATICGAEEQDRYIVLSASGEGFDVAINIAKTLDDIHRNKGWEPKRTLIFCVFIGPDDLCGSKFLNRIKSKIVAYVAIHGNAAKGTDEIIVSGTGMVQATIIDSTNQVKYYHGVDIVQLSNFLPTLNLKIPNAAISFKDQAKSSSVDQNQKILAQIVGLTMWKLSEEIFFQWDPKYFSEIMHKAVSAIKLEELKASKNALNESIARLVQSVTNFNVDLEKMNLFKALDIRKINDQLIDFERALLCPDRDLPSPMIIADFESFLHEPAHTVDKSLNKIRNCYETANKILQEQRHCSKLFNSLDQV